MYADLLIDTCTILEDTGAIADAYGTMTEDWRPILALTDIDCRLESAKGREIRVGAEVVVADYTLFVEDVIVTEQNRIRMGEVDYDILLVEAYSNGTAEHHKQVWLQVVR